MLATVQISNQSSQKWHLTTQQSSMIFLQISGVLSLTSDEKADQTKLRKWLSCRKHVSEERQSRTTEHSTNIKGCKHRFNQTTDGTCTNICCMQ